MVILPAVKTAISIPDALFDAADRVARELGISRSELYQRAVAAFVERYRREGVTARLDAVYAEQPPHLDDVLRYLQTASLPRQAW
jgi:predicted transcriptional regulator